MGGPGVDEGLGLILGEERIDAFIGAAEGLEGLKRESPFIEVQAADEVHVGLAAQHPSGFDGGVVGGGGGHGERFP